jgi:hypothetical protein
VKIILTIIALTAAIQVSADDAICPMAGQNDNQESQAPMLGANGSGIWKYRPSSQEESTQP